jgi:hypothetical protein
MAWNEKYVTADGSDTYANASSILTPCSLDTAIDNAAAGDRINILSGSYSQGAVTGTGGTVAAPIVFRGYKTGSLDSLDTQPKNNNGTVDTTDFPVITLTGIWVPGAFNILQNLSFTGSLNSALVGNNGVDNVTYLRCSVTNTASNAAARAVICDNSLMAISCYFSCTGASHASVVDADLNGFLYDCMILGASTSGLLLTLDEGTCVSCVFIGSSKTEGATGIAYSTSTLGRNTSSIANTFYNLTTAISHPNAATAQAPLIFVSNVCTDCGRFVNNLYATEVGAVLMYNRLRDVTNADASLLAVVINSITTDTGGTETDFEGAGSSPPDLRIITASPAKGAGIPRYADCGGLQRAEPAASGGGTRAWASIG